MEKKIKNIINGDCIEVMKTLDEGSIDLIVTSPPYGVGIEYDVHQDDMEWEQYVKFTYSWMEQAYRVLKDDGRICLNLPYEINRQDKGGRIFMIGEVWQIMKEIGYKFFGVVDLEEESPHRSRTTAWGSWMSPSAPYIYNPKECVILAYKKHHIKKVKGEPEWVGELGEREDKNGVMKKATFSMDIPTKAIKILTYKNDIVLDPFAGSGTTLVAAEVLDRQWIGIELSPNYAEVARKRVNTFVLEKQQQVIEL